MKERRPSGIKVEGFETLPCGQLLNQFVDFDHSMGAAYERCITYVKDYHTHNRLNLCFPRGASRIVITTKSPSEKFTVDETSLVWMPEAVEHRQDTASVIYDNLALFPDRSALEKSVRRLGKIYGDFSLPTKTIKLKRTKLIAELLNQYFFDRVLEKKSPALLEATADRILDEVMLLAAKVHKDSVRSPLNESEETVALRAIQYIEGNLFGSIDTKVLSRFAGSSSATLFRKFRDATGLTPHEYVRRRRLDESVQLLKTGNYNVGDVAILVGYEDLAAFSKSFKQRFKAPPSEYLAHH